MTKNKHIIFIMFGVILIVLVELYVYYFRFIREKEKTDITVVVYEDDKNWADLKEGAELAASKEDNVEVYFQVVPADLTADEQIEVINNEFESGADYVIASAIDSYELGTKLNGAYIPRLSFVANGIDDERYNIVSPNDYEMGYQLGKLIESQESYDAKIGIVHTDEKKESLNARCKGLTDALDERNSNYVVWNQSDAYSGIRAFVYSEIVKGNVDIVISINEGSLDYITAAVKDSGIYVPVYAIAHSDKAVYYLDSRKIKNLVYPDEFGEGYTAVTNALQHSKKGNKYSDDIITFKIISRDDMYSGEYEKVLFPFVK